MVFGGPGGTSRGGSKVTTPLHSLVAPTGGAGGLIVIFILMFILIILLLI